MAAVIAQAVVNGLLIGGIYALVSIGVTLIFGVVKIVNFAQGEFVMIGMYISLLAGHSLRDRPDCCRLVVSMPVLFVVGVLLQHFLIRQGSGAGRHAPDLPHLCAFAAADQPRAAAVHCRLSDGAHELHGLGDPHLDLCIASGQAHRLRAGHAAQRRTVGSSCAPPTSARPCAPRRRTATWRC